MRKIKTYELFCHWKQGDDLAHYLEQYLTPQTALTKWAEKMEHNAKQVRRLAELFKEKELHIDADTHYIGLSGDESALENAVAEDILDLYETEYYEEEDYELELNSVISEEILNAREIEHRCFSCERTLTFDEYNSANIYEFSQKRLIDLWCNNSVRFYCCECLSKLKCKKCDSKLEPFKMEDEHWYYFCPHCIKEILKKTCSKLSIHQTDNLAKLLVKLNKYIINLNE